VKGIAAFWEIDEKGFGSTVLLEALLEFLRSWETWTRTRVSWLVS
jgi:hypothetical protein